ncbi:hypothetical protein NQ314_005148 [Rhamnusium bicolor]|uniref:DDE Tnp4 domain-containing protein n=1 Tax=Rhamnusium bicolor TaxID=1586634 RepID=A0AAV8ZHT0_9CUCU|nr:hypothetical protein NQ314_005148 [Rhamnusium bicolor]
MALIGLGAILHNRVNERQRNEEFNLKRKQLRDASNPFQLTDFEFIRLFRADRETARYLVNRIQGQLLPSRSDGLTPQMKICDERLRILNVNANFPGSVHVQFIFNASKVKQEMRRLHRDRIGKYFLLGDSGYALDKYMLIPVLNTLLDTAEER